MDNFKQAFKHSVLMDGINRTVSVSNILTGETFLDDTDVSVFCVKHVSVSFALTQSHLLCAQIKGLASLRTHLGLFDHVLI